MVDVMHSGTEFTVDDLDRFPDDGNRYELIEGSLHVSPSPGLPHQRALRNLFLAYESACPPEYGVWFAPLDVVFAHNTVLVPDLIVLPADVRDGTNVQVVPLLAAEVLSPSTRSYDLVHKRHVFREHGVGTYLVVDPREASVTAWTDDAEQHAEGDDELRLTDPFPVRLRPSTLLA